MMIMNYYPHHQQVRRYIWYRNLYHQVQLEMMKVIRVVLMYRKIIYLLKQQLFLLINYSNSIEYMNFELNHRYHLYHMMDLNETIQPVYHRMYHLCDVLCFDVSDMLIFKILE
jgi:hypothetical protein